MKRTYAVVLFALFALWASAASRAAAPDLTASASDVVVTPSYPTPDSSVAITVNVHNVGSAASGATTVSVKVLLGSKKAFSGKASLPSIPAGASAPATLSVGKLSAAAYTVSIKVDPGNKVKEADEGNNAASVALSVAAASGDAGKDAAAVFETSQRTADSLLGVCDVAMAGLRSTAVEDAETGEAAHPCTRSGALDYAIERTGLRVTRVTVTSPAQGSTECESWLARDSSDQDLGYYERFAGSVVLDVRYLSDVPTDPGYLKIASMTLAAGDGNPSTPDAFTVGTYESYRDSGGALQTRLIIAESCDLAVNISVTGWDGLGFPNHLVFMANGLLTHYDAELAGSLAVALAGFTMDASYTGSAGDLGTALILGGSVSASNSLSSAGNFSVAFRSLAMNLHVTPTLEQVTVSGGFDLISSCATGSFQVSTLETVGYAPGALCPQMGKVAVWSSLGSATIQFNADQSLSIDEGSDGTVDVTYPICWEASFSMCGQGEFGT